MKRKIITGDGIENPGDIIELSDGNIVIGEGNHGFAKINSDDKTVDNSFSSNKRNFRGLWNDTCTVNGTGTTTDSRVKYLNDLGLATNVQNISGDVIYGADKYSNGGKIVGINPSGECVEVINFDTLQLRPSAMEIRTIANSDGDDEDHLFVSGTGKIGGSWKKRFYTKNLTTGDDTTCGGNYGGSLGAVISKGTDLTVDNSGRYVYYIWRGSIYGYGLTRTGNNFCPTDEPYDRKLRAGNGSSRIRPAAGMEISRDGTGSDDIMSVSYTHLTLPTNREV